MKKNFVISSAKQLLNAASNNLNIVAKNESSDNVRLVKASKDGQVCCDWMPTFHGLQPNGADQLALS